MADCLDEWLGLLCRRARWLSLSDADARERWFADVVELLAHVQEPTRRAIWAVSLAESFAGIGCPTDLVFRELCRRLAGAR